MLLAQLSIAQPAAKFHFCLFTLVYTIIPAEIFLPTTKTFLLSVHNQKARIKIAWPWVSCLFCASTFLMALLLLLFSTFTQNSLHRLTYSYRFLIFSTVNSFTWILSPTQLAYGIFF